MQQINSDILIIGGGSAGIAAAVSASEAGLSVILVEKFPYLGGNATSAEVGTICGIYHRSKSSTPQFIVDGFGKEFSEKLKVKSGSHVISNQDGLHFLPYSVEKYKEIALEYLTKHEVKTIFNGAIVDIEVEDNKAKYCIVNQNEKVIRINFEAIVDCSGSSIVSRLANSPLIKSERFQSAALVFSMKNVACTDEHLLNFIVIKHLRSAVLDGLINSELGQLFMVPGSLRDGQISFKVAIPLEVTLTKNNLSSLKQKGGEMVMDIVKLLTSEIDAFKNAMLDHVAEAVGIRTTNRTQGKYILTEQDVLECRKFNNAVANCSWPIEEWLPLSKVKMDYLPEEDYYQIPAECLVSAHIENLFLGGKNISASDRAIGSARVMGICFQTGYAAGRLASQFANHTSKKNVKELIHV